MKNIYQVTTFGFDHDRIHGTFEDKILADTMCKKVNDFNKNQVDKAQIVFIPTYTLEDPLYTHQATIYLDNFDSIIVKPINPTYTHLNSLEFVGEKYIKPDFLSICLVGTSENNATEQTLALYQELKNNGLLEKAIQNQFKKTNRP